MSERPTNHVDPIVPDTVVPAGGGLFDDPLWFRLPIALLVGAGGVTLLYWSGQLLRSGDFLATLTVLLGIDPLGVFLVALAAALVAPRSCLANWFHQAKKLAAIVIGVWAVLIVLGAALFFVFSAP